MKNPRLEQRSICRIERAPQHQDQLMHFTLSPPNFAFSNKHFFQTFSQLEEQRAPTICCRSYHEKEILNDYQQIQESFIIWTENLESLLISTTASLITFCTNTNFLVTTSNIKNRQNTSRTKMSAPAPAIIKSPINHLKQNKKVGVYTQILKHWCINFEEILQHLLKSPQSYQKRIVTCEKIL